MTLLGLVLLLVLQQSVLWLDSPPSNWNTGGATIPAAEQAPTTLPTCSNDERAAATPAESQLAAQGWKLESYWPPIGAASEQIVLATTGYDGMCRPWQFNAFVFSDGHFAGTLAPEPMNSREDGTLVGTPSVSADGTIEAEYTRYAPSDPLCCPSLGRTPVVYTVVSTEAGPVLTPVQIGAATAIPAPVQIP